MTRGLVLGPSLDDIAARAKALGSPTFVDGYYLLKDHNGGKDPTAADPFDRWSNVGSSFVNRTADCIGGASWCGGFDRYQPVRFPLYSGWINTDSMLDDAQGAAVCFETLTAPVPGCFVVARTGAPGFALCGHIGTVYEVPATWDMHSDNAWRQLMITDVASRGAARANTSHDATWWMAAVRAGKGAFVTSKMTP